MKVGNLSEKEFRIMIVKIIQAVNKRMEAKIEKMQEMFTKDLQELKNKQLEGINSRITEVEKWINDLEGRRVEITATKQNKEKRMKRNEDSIRDLCNNIKYTNICIIRVPEGAKREK